MKFFAPCAKGLEYLLVDELKSIGAEDVHEALMGVHFSGDLRIGYNAVLWSRLASRVLLLLHNSRIESADELYQAVQSVDWAEHMDVDDSLIINFVGVNDFIVNSQFGALKSKDAIIDQFRQRFNQRPDIDSEQPTLRINAHVHRNDLSLAIDLSGHPLHERGYRLKTGKAPLKETLAAAMLIRAKWPGIAAKGGGLVDPFCGSGTLPIEAYLMAANIAPGLLRDDFGCTQGWKQHDTELWQQCRNEAQQQSKANDTISPIMGFDKNNEVLEQAQQNAQRALNKFQHEYTIQFSRRDIAGLQALPSDVAPGLVICNPPYGERLDNVEDLKPLYALLGEQLLQYFDGWQAAVITSEPALARAVKIRAFKQYALKNAQLDCKLYLFHLHADEKRKVIVDHDTPSHLQAGKALSESAQAVANRIKKNLKGLRSSIKKEQWQCYRVYDADIPEYSAAIDIYNDHLLIQEYQAPKTIPEKKSQKRFQELCHAAQYVFNTEPENCHIRTRQKQKGTQQYDKYTRDWKPKNNFIVEENGLKFEINLTDYLDSGLFLDHRTTRQLIQQRAKGKHVLNLFSYTGSMSVYAAAGGAASINSIEMSRPYSEWAKRNFLLNGFNLTESENKSSRYQFTEADVLSWLDDEKNQKPRYDLIFLDPPTFSNSKRMENTLDAQRDHADLIRRCMALLNDDGELIFSSSFRKFKLDADIDELYDVENWQQKTLPKDFSRSPKIHHCWRICNKRSGVPTSDQEPR